MAKSLLSLKQRNDFNGRQIRCLVVEDVETGSYSKVREPWMFQEVIESNPASLLTMVFEPTEAERSKLVKLLATNAQEQASGYVATIGEEDVLLALLEMTDLEMNPEDLVANRELMKEILAQPSPLFLSLKSELDFILVELVSALEDYSKAYQKMPNEMIDVLNQLQQLEQVEKENTKKIEKKQQEIERLRQQLAELEGEMDETNV